MEKKEFYAEKENASGFDIFGVIAFFIKILLGGILLCTALYLIFWSIEVVEQILYHPENVPLINAFLQSHEGKNLLQITSQGESFVIENGLFIQWLILVFIVLLIFNVIGRALSAVFQCVFKLVSDLDVSVMRKKESEKV